MSVPFIRKYISIPILFGLLFVIGSCIDEVDKTGFSKPIPDNADFVSSLDSSLIHSEDNFNAIFIENISFNIKPIQYNTLKEISFKIYPKTGTLIVDTFTISYSKDYIDSHFSYDPIKMQITLPVFGLYDAYLNTVLVNTIFSNGMAWQKKINIETKRFANTDKNNLAIFVSTAKPDFSYLYLNTNKGPMIMDVEGNIRWASNELLNSSTPVSVFVDNYLYCVNRSNPFNNLIKLGFYGSQDTISVNAGNYPGTFFHHEMGLGPKGFLLEVDIKDKKTSIQKSSVLIEIDTKGNLLQTWDMDNIIGKCLEESNVPVTNLIRNATNNGEALDWFHMNSSCYNKSDNSVLISSRENFVIKVGYDDKEIKWILGDTTKFWYTIDTLKHYAIHLEQGNINIGQHCLSVLENGEILMFNNGNNSTVPYFPKDRLGSTYINSSVSCYKIYDDVRKAVQTFNHDLLYSSPTRGSVQKIGDIYLTSSLPEVPEYSSLINIFDNRNNLLLEIRNYSYFCNKVEVFDSKIKY